MSNTKNIEEKHRMLKRSKNEISNDENIDR